MEHREPVEIDVGRVIAGKYELVKLIGKGAMGEVWLARHDTLGGEFAVKLVQPRGDVEDAEIAGRFQLEAQVSAKLSRKTRHIVSVSDHGEEDGLAYLVMELLEGESLDARIKRAGRMELAETVALAMQIARALGQAHAEGIFHRDLKPANVFLTKDEDGRLLVKLLDFGIARSEKPVQTRSPFATGKDMVLGTPSYMSPEQARGLDTLDYRCDLWALAVVVYEALTERIPWEGDTIEDIFLSICTHRMTPIRSVRPDLPPAIDAVFERAFATTLEARFASAQELSEALEALVDPMLVDAAVGPPGARVGRGSNPQLPRMGSDPVGFSVGGATIRTRRKRSTGWVVAMLAVLASVGIAVIGLVIVSRQGRDTSTATARSAPPHETTSTTTATTNDRVDVPPPPEATAAKIDPTPEPPATKPKATPARAPARVAQPSAPPERTAPAPPAPVTPVTAHTTPAPPAASTPAPPKTNEGKSGVF